MKKKNKKTTAEKSFNDEKVVLFLLFRCDETGDLCVREERVGLAGEKQATKCPKIFIVFSGGGRGTGDLYEHCV